MSKTEHSSGVTKLPRVIIVGGGFGGLAAAKVLAKAPVQVVLIDKVNHSLFQPLLYQVAGSMLDAGDIAFPIRGEFRKEKNVIVAMAEVTGIDKDERCVYVTNWPRPIEYDYLVLATGVEGSYFGHDEWAPHAPGMKTLSDAIRLRSRILEAFEDAELQEDPRAHPEFTTFVLVGAGPTGCELAGTLAEMFRETLKSEFRRFDPEMARIIVVEAGPRVLPMFSPGLSEKALLKLERMGVEVRLGHPVEQVDAEGVTIAGERIRTRTVIWTAGVTATPVGRWLAVETDSDGTGQGRARPQRPRTSPDFCRRRRSRDHPEWSAPPRCRSGCSSERALRRESHRPKGCRRAGPSALRLSGQGHPRNGRPQLCAPGVRPLQAFRPHRQARLGLRPHLLSHGER